jgi:uncharacterized protein (TIGR02996 family)
MNTDERAFLDAICAQPDDDTARLVYADWLAENGQADRGEFIRADIEFARTPPNTETDERRRRVLLERRTELLKKHKTAWLAPFVPFAKDGAFVRGFVQALEVPANTFLQQAEKWFALAPLTRVKFTACSVYDPSTASHTWWSAELFASPYLSRLEAIDLEAQRVVATDIERLAEHPNLARLRELVLAWNAIRSEGAKVLAQMPQLSGLQTLDLRGNGISDSGARALAESPHLTHLAELWMSRNPIRERSWSALEDRFGDALVG